MKIKKRENFGMKRTKQRKAMLRSGNFNSYSVPRSKKNIILDKMFCIFIDIICNYFIL